MTKTLPTPHVRVEQKTSRDVTRWDVWLVASPTYVETVASCTTPDEARHVARNIADERDVPFIDTRTTTRVIAVDRDETDPCEANTPGCCIDHMRDHGDCETW